VLPLVNSDRKDAAKLVRNCANTAMFPAAYLLPLIFLVRSSNASSLRLIDVTT
jgi:hypothetical protein